MTVPNLDRDTLFALIDASRGHTHLVPTDKARALLDAGLVEDAMGELTLTDAGHATLDAHTVTVLTVVDDSAPQRDVWVFHGTPAARYAALDDAVAAKAHALDLLETGQDNPWQALVDYGLDVYVDETWVQAVPDPTPGTLPGPAVTPDGWVETDRDATDMRTWEHETKPAWIVTHASNADDPAPFGWAAGLDQDGHYLRTGKAATWDEAATAALAYDN